MDFTVNIKPVQKGLQKTLSEQGTPLFENVNAILHAMGYQLVPQALAMDAKNE